KSSSRGILRRHCSAVPTKKLICGLNCYRGTVKFRQTEAVEDLVVTSSLFFEDPDCNRFAELMRLSCIGAPVNAGDVSTEPHVRSDLVEFAAYRYISSVRTRIRYETQPIIGWLHWSESDID